MTSEPKDDLWTNKPEKQPVVLPYTCVGVYLSGSSSPARKPVKDFDLEHKCLSDLYTQDAKTHFWLCRTWIKEAS